MRRRLPRGPLVALVGALLRRQPLAPVLQRAVGAQLPTMTDDRFAGLQWRFVRIQYHYTTEGTNQEQDFYGEPWAIDAPAAEQNLSRRIKTATTIQVEDPIDADARRSAAVHLPVDLHGGAGQPEADRQGRRRRCASSCCAAAR